MIATTSGQLGRLNTMAEHAVLAVEAFRYRGRPYDLTYANAHYLSGVGRFFEGDSTDAILDFHIARSVFATIDTVDLTSNVRISSLWFELARGEADATELAQIDAQIAASDFPDTGFAGFWDLEATEAVVYDVDAVPRHRRPPSYPPGAAQNDLDGLVLVRFDVTENGRSDAVEIVAAAPGGVFDDAVLRAMRGWQYEPATIDGHPVRRTGVVTKFLFSMCDLPTAHACRQRQESQED